MTYECKIIADSANPNNERVTTFQLTYPRSIHSEFLTHRMITSNSASSRAIPIEKMLEKVNIEPYIPIFTRNQAGMQGIDASTDTEFQRESTRLWLSGRDWAVQTAIQLKEHGVHKQDCNRVLEPWLWHTVIATSTTWANFFALRTHEAAHPAIQTIATMMADAYIESSPEPLAWEQWHLPFITQTDREAAYAYLQQYGRKDFSRQDLFMLLCRMSTARCARVSYMRHTDEKSIEEDIALHDRLVGSNPKHSSPTGHQAQADWYAEASGNFRGGWLQYRHTIKGESVKTFEWKGVKIQ